MSETPTPAVYYFVTDEGGRYEVRDYGQPVDHHGLTARVVAEGLRSRTTYIGEGTRLEVTGGPRRFPAISGLGHRARLHLDTGEGVTLLRGVVAGPR